MIEDNLRTLLLARDKFDFTYSVNTSHVKDNAVTVYSSSGAQPSTYEGVLISPRYQVVVKSSDFDAATETAYDVYDYFNAIKNTLMTVQLKTRTLVYRVFEMYALQEPILLGENDDRVLEYSINFETKMIRVNEHHSM